MMDMGQATTKSRMSPEEDTKEFKVKDKIVSENCKIRLSCVLCLCTVHVSTLVSTYNKERSKGFWPWLQVWKDNERK